MRITDLKLGPEGITTLNPAPEELTDFSSVRYVYVTYHDFEERWALYVRQTELVVALSAADLWRNTGTLSIASQPGAETVALEYRRSGTEEWRAARRDARGGRHLLGTYRTPAGASRPMPQASRCTRSTRRRVSSPATPTNTASHGGRHGHRRRHLRNARRRPHPQGGMEEAGMSCFTQQNADAAFWASGNNTFAGGLCQWSTFPEWRGALRQNGRDLGRGRAGRGQPALGHLLQGRTHERRGRIRPALRLDGAPHGAPPEILRRKDRHRGRGHA